MCEEDAWERVKWYKWRWFLEDFHKVLKTGCKIEVRRQQTVGAMCNLLPTGCATRYEQVAKQQKNVSP
jgi:hypothetical protein